MRQTLKNQANPGLLIQYIDRYKKKFSSEWLLGIELLELAHKMKLEKSIVDSLTVHLRNLPSINESAKKCIEDGIQVAPQIL